MTKTSEPVVARIIAQWDEWRASVTGFGPEARVVVGLSGGPDSLALWHALTAAGIHPRECVIAACLDHGLRPEAAAEVDFLRRLVSDAGCAFHEARADVPALARAEGLSVEEAARVARYRFLAEVATAAGTRLVAVGHNADDQAETVLMHFLRGSGLAGLRGMLPVSPLPGAGDLFLLRPLLQVARSDIEVYCATHELKPLFDASNLDTTYFRNRLRHHMLPELAAASPGLPRRLRHMADVLAADEDLLAAHTAQALTDLIQSGAEGYLALSLVGWRSLPLGLRRRVLRAAVGALAPGLRDVAFETVELARSVAERGHAGQRSSLPGGIVLTVGYDSLVLARVGAAPQLALPQLPGAGHESLALPGRLAMANGWFLAAERDDEPSLPHIRRNMDPWQAWIALPASVDRLLVRPRAPGEYFQPLGLGGRHATVKAVMINRKVPSGARARWPIVALPEHLVWVVGHQLDRRVAVRLDSPSVWRLDCRRPEETL